MNVRRSRALASVLGAVIGSVALAACAADEKEPPADPCQKLTGAERTECERPQAPPPDAKQAEPPPDAKQAEPPPDTKSEANERSDTADPPQG